jgi:hypothetical protein
MGLVSVRELTAAVEGVDEVLGVNLQGVSSVHLRLVERYTAGGVWGGL